MDRTKDKTQTRSFFILLYTPIALTIFRYYGSAEFYDNHISLNNGPENQYYYFLASFFLLGIIPLLINTVGFKAGLSGLGIGLGDKKKGALVVAVGLPIMAVIAYLASKNPALAADYPLCRSFLANGDGLPLYFLLYGLYYVGWETYFRGFMLFGLKQDFGEKASILIQTIPSCLVHIGKPAPEVFASIIAGLIFGWVALRCRSMWPIFVCHWGLGVFLDIFIIYG